VRDKDLKLTLGLKLMLVLKLLLFLDVGSKVGVGSKVAILVLKLLLSFLKLLVFLKWTRATGGSEGFFFCFTLVTGPRRSLSLKLSDTRISEP